MTVDYWAAWVRLAARAEPVTLAAWAAEAGSCRSKLCEARRHDAALRALPTRRAGRPARKAHLLEEAAKRLETRAAIAARGVEHVKRWASERASR